MNQINFSIRLVKFLFILSFCLLFFNTLEAENTGIKFERITVDQGLPDNTILSIYQDRSGFIWFGTREGLCKYDGFTFQKYKNDMLKAKTAYDNYGNVVYEDREGNFWVGTAGELYSFNPDSEKFTSYGLNIIYGIVEDKSGNLWLGTREDGLFKLNKNTGKTDNYSAGLFGRKDKTTLITSMSASLDSDGMIWIGTKDRGIFRFNPETFDSKQYNSDMSGEIRLDDFSISAIQLGKNGDLWLGTYGSGIKQFNPKTGKIIHYHENSDTLTSISDDTVRALYFDSDEEILWIGTESGGLNKFNPEDKQFTVYKHEPSDPKSLSYDGVWSIFKDRSGIMWAGTRRRGVNKFNPRKMIFHNFTYKPTSSKGLKYNTIWSIYEDSNKQIWVGAQGGLFQLQANTLTGKKELVPWMWNSSQYKNNFQHPVRDFCEDQFGFMWLGLLSGGIVRLNKATGETIPFHHNKMDSSSLCSNYVYTIYKDIENTIWIGTNGGGLARLDRTQDEKLHFSYFPYLPKSPKNYEGWIFTIHESGHWLPGFLWIGSWRDGLLLFEKRTSKFIFFKHHPEDTTSISKNTIVTIYEDKKERIWLGTYGGGLDQIIFPNPVTLTKDQFKPDQIRFAHYMEKDGLCNNIVYNILEDDFGNLWLGTNNGLSRFNPETKQFTNYFTEDGLPGNGFNLGAKCKSKTGELYFGGDYGVTSFYPTHKVNTNPPEIALTSFKKLGHKVYFKKRLRDREKIELKYNENYFSFDFVALHYQNPAKNSCAYKLEGFDKDWTYVTGKGAANFKNINPGKYTFRVKAANCDDVWNEKGVAVQIVIHPPFWNTWWFYSLLLLFFGGIVFTFHQYRINQALKIERTKIEERERTRKKLAADFHDELGHRVTNISLISKILKEQIKSTVPYINDSLQNIADNADGLYKDWKEFIWELDPGKNQVCDLAIQLKNFSDQLFDKANIAFQVKIHPQDLETVKLPFEWRQHLLRIFKEGMNNILKHCSECENVTLEFKSEDGFLVIILADDGSGFNPADNFTGYGLKNMKQRADQINCDLKIRSQKPGGSQILFRGKLP